MINNNAEKYLLALMDRSKYESQNIALKACIGKTEIIDLYERI